MTTKETVRPRPARPPLPKPEDSDSEAPAPAEIYGPTQPVAVRIQSDSTEVITLPGLPPKAPDEAVSSPPPEDKPADAFPTTRSPTVATHEENTRESDARSRVTVISKTSPTRAAPR